MNNIQQFIQTLFKNSLGISNINSISSSEHGVTNQTFFVCGDEKMYVVRIPGIGTNDYIDRENEIINMTRASKIIKIPKIYYADSCSGILVSQYISNSRVLDKNIFRSSKLLDKSCEILASLHNSQIEFKKSFNILEEIKKYKRILSNIESKSFQYEIKVKYNMKYLEELLKRLVYKYPAKEVPCHIDPKLSNFLISDNELFLIDWEYSGMADLYFELANFALTNELNDYEEQIFLNSYFKVSNISFNRKKYYFYKIITDYLWIYWHLIKLHQRENIEYNKNKWMQRMNRAMKNIQIMERERLL